MSVLALWALSANAIADTLAEATTTFTTSTKGPMSCNSNDGTFVHTRKNAGRGTQTPMLFLRRSVISLSGAHGSAITKMLADDGDTAKTANTTGKGGGIDGDAIVSVSITSTRGFNTPSQYELRTESGEVSGSMTVSGTFENGIRFRDSSGRVGDQQFRAECYGNGQITVSFSIVVVQTVL